MGKLFRHNFRLLLVGTCAATACSQRAEPKVDGASVRDASTRDATLSSDEPAATEPTLPASDASSDALSGLDAEASRVDASISVDASAATGRSDTGRSDTGANDAGPGDAQPDLTADAHTTDLASGSVTTTSGSDDATNSHDSNGLDPSSATTTTSTEASPSSTSDCALEAFVNLSPTIGTVGIFTLATNQSGIKDGYVDFGPEATYGMRATLDTSSADFRTLLLGMTANRTYHYRVVVHTEDATCIGPDQSLTTGGAPALVPVPQVDVGLSNQISPGFVVTSTFGSTSDDDGYVMIYNHHGQLVWWFQSILRDITRSRISWDGKYVYARDANPTGGPGGQVVRIAMDGTREEQVEIDTGHHDMAVAPTNGLFFLTGQGRDRCSTISYLSPTGGLSRFYDLRDAFGDSFRPGEDPCHCNSIDYNLEDRSITVSCLNQNAFVKLTESGELSWVLGGNQGQSEFVGDVHWNRQHGHHLVSPTRLVFYNNDGGGDSSATTSVAVELELDLLNRTATRVWQYVGGETSLTLGDAQRLPNGNTLITYSNSATIREVTPDRAEVQTWVFDRDIGYSEHLTSLYGRTPRP